MVWRRGALHAVAAAGCIRGQHDDRHLHDCHGLEPAAGPRSSSLSGFLLVGSKSLKEALLQYYGQSYFSSVQNIYFAHNEMQHVCKGA